MFSGFTNFLGRLVGTKHEEKEVVVVNTDRFPSDVYSTVIETRNEEIDYTSKAKNLLIDEFSNFKFNFNVQTIEVKGFIKNEVNIYGKSLLAYYKNGDITIEHNFKFNLEFSVTITETIGLEPRVQQRKNHVIKGVLEIPNLCDINISTFIVIPHFESQSLSSSLSGFLYNQVTSCVTSNKMKNKIIEKVVKFEGNLAAYLIQKNKLVRMGGRNRRGGIINMQEKIYTRTDNLNGSNHLGFDGVTIIVKSEALFDNNINDDEEEGTDSDNENISNNNSRRSSKSSITSKK